MAEWKGFDSGGTEQLWESEVLMDMLTVVKVYEPFTRNDQTSPIFDELETLYPEITWRNVNADGSFRPIFRKANPLVKLGLTTDEPVDAYVTSLGDDLLSGSVSISEVYTFAAKSHRERDGTPSMALMCAAALEVPDEVFSLEDIEFGISENYDPANRNAAAVLKSVRSQGVTFGASSSVRQRRLRNFMAAIVSTGAMQHVEAGWTLNDRAVASDIASAVGAAIAPSVVTKKVTGKKVAKKKVAKNVARRVQPSNIRSIIAGKRKQITVKASVDSVTDPIQRALLLERANNVHEQLVQAVANIIRDRGFDPLEDSNSFDVAVEGENEALIEVKTINRDNCISQIRKAVSQLPEYRWKHRERFSSDAKQIVVLSENPTQYVDDDFFEYLVEDRGLIVTWQQQGALADLDGQSLEEILFPQH